MENSMRNIYSANLIREVNLIARKANLIQYSFAYGNGDFYPFHHNYINLKYAKRGGLKLLQGQIVIAFSVFLSPHLTVLI